MLFLVSKAIFAQQIPADSGKLTISGYAEIYYDYDFNKPLNNTLPPFIVSYNRANEVNLNLGFIETTYSSNNIRANFALMAGTYANANLADEPGVLKNIYEANIGIKLAKKADLWFDAGIFPSHIGFESAVGKDCWTLTRSIVADNSPYYESGAKISYTTPNGKIFISALLLNGWQHIERPAGNTDLAGGLQVTLNPVANITINYSNFYGNDKPDSVSRMRFYNDLYAILQITKKIGFTAGIDYATEQKSTGSSSYNQLFSPIIILRYTPVERFAVAARFEYYQDPDGILIPTNTPDGFKTAGYSLNADYSPYKNVLLRIEGKYYHSDDAIFTRDSHPVNGDFITTASMSISF